MFSKATLFATVLAACIGASAAPQEIWNPKITSPDAGTVWPAGSTQLVTWDTSDAPASISEQSGILLAANDHPLAQGFDLRSGSQSVTIPADTAPGSDYQIVLLGDSGNLSGAFIIV
ncbi:hypothetical protein PHLGIDRAFT_73062 [Phlebiopsis gigantea 11061_1 CR5-6]|uniref:Yeast cell wall synthesis Kre9/Knh1-like N-terminal domain-containing protein n=1 Tax=Phlebiopsis gigantea (strain 11061_1 CR5-6) TaxID=745531 RepID=A0A0C3S6I7_PHLG1|nr:hypothetical protein PHLGIDRAFT_73062 [Phlebiopsis gigantea 11061_1 CR5-6]